MDFQAEKAVILDLYAALERSGADPAAELECRTSGNYMWRGYYPFGELTGPATVGDVFWKPFLGAFSSLQRRQDIFFAGLNEIDGFASVWVVSMGHLVGLFDRPWLGIKPTGKMAFLRYCEFNRVEGDKIAETALYFDIARTRFLITAILFLRHTTSF